MEMLFNFANYALFCVQKKGIWFMKDFDFQFLMGLYVSESSDLS